MHVTSSMSVTTPPRPRAHAKHEKKTPPCVVVQIGRRLVEDFYRSKGIEPTLLQPPSSAIAAAAAAAAAAGRPGGVAPRARLSDPMMPTEAMIGHLGRGRPMAGPGPAAAVAGAGAGMRAPSGPIPQGARPVAQPVMYGGGHGGGGGGVGGDVSGDELPELLRVARCEHHLERFLRDQLDGEVLLEMERRDFDRMGVTEVCVCVFYWSRRVGDSGCFSRCGSPGCCCHRWFDCKARGLAFVFFMTVWIVPQLVFSAKLASVSPSEWHDISV